MSRQIILDILDISPILADELHRSAFAFHTNTLLFRQLIVMQEQWIIPHTATAAAYPKVLPAIPTIAAIKAPSAGTAAIATATPITPPSCPIPLLAEALYTNSSSNLAAAIQCNHLGNIRYSGDHRSCNVRSR